MAQRKTTSEDILNEAEALFRQKGYRNTTMADIAKATGLLKGSLYYYYPSKEELASAILSRVQSGVGGYIIGLAHDEERSPAERLRAKGLLAHTVRVALETNRFQPGPQYAARRCQTLFHPTDATPALHKAAQGLLDVLYRSGFAYQKIGVTLLELVPHNHRQASLFPPAAAETGRQRDLMRTVDHLNTVYGRDTVTWASSGLGPQQWHMRQNHVSPRYTTAWDELPCVG